MIITLEDETASANLIFWPSVFESNQRTIFGTTLLACRVRLQCANGVIHVIAEEVNEMTAALKRISDTNEAFPSAAGRVDEANRGGSGLDSRERKAIAKPRHMYVLDLHIDTLKQKVRNFR